MMAKKILAVELAIREHAYWSAADTAGILWSMIDDVSFSDNGEIARARWKAKLVFNTTKDPGIEGISIPKNVVYEEQIVELKIMNEDNGIVSYFVAEWDVDKEAAKYFELFWDDERITQQDIDCFCNSQDTYTLCDELVERFGTKANVNFDLFPMRLRFFLKTCLHSNADL